MQTVIQVIATGTGSLRNKIMTDPQLDEKIWIPRLDTSARGVHTAGQKSIAQPTFMARSTWNGTRRSRTLICRVVTKLGNKPNSIIGDFVDYLLARHQSRILAIHIMRR